MTEDEIVGWHQQFNGHELRQIPRDGKGQGGLACCSPGACEESNITWRQNNSNNQSLRDSQLFFIMLFNHFFKNSVLSLF